MDADVSLQRLIEGLSAVPALIETVRALEKEVTLLKRQIAMHKEEQSFLRLKEAATALNVSEKTVRRYIQRGLLRQSLTCRHILIPVEDVRSFAGKALPRQRS